MKETWTTKIIYMKKLTIILFSVLLFSCNRKLHTEKTETKSSDTKVINVDSLIEVNKTLSQAYEELLKTTNSTGVVFESQPCDTVRIPGKPSVINKITVSPDGTKTFEGNIKSYKDDNTKLQQRIFSQQETIDSLRQLSKKDTTHHEQSHIETIRTVKVVTFPWWLIAAGIIFFLLWINERFSLFKIPFITRTSLFNKQKTSL